jgi:eukaryotic-like serine/threonine-protein kinase
MFTGTSRYELVTKLGEGGMGVVYEAHDRVRGMRLALKALRSISADSIMRFKREFRALGDLSHPNIIHLYDLVQEGEHWFLTMELIEGEDIISYVRAGRTVATAEVNVYARGTKSDETITAETRASINLRRDLGTSTAALISACLPVPLPIRHQIDEVVDLERLRTVLGPLADGLHTLHAADLVHCDLKPSNVLVTRSGRPVLMDFGIVAELRQPSPGPLDYMGTPHYMAPEQARHAPVNPAVDWYSFGVLLYVALTGQLPYQGRRSQVVQVKQNCDPLPPSSFAAGLPADLESLCMDLLRRDPAERPTGMEVLARLGMVRRMPVHSGEISLPDAIEAPPRPKEESPCDAPPWGRSMTPFVGRAHELALMRQSYAATRAGGTRCVLVQGLSGIGKSALIARFVAELRMLGGDQPLVLSGRCHERESLAYKAFDGVMDDLIHHLLAMPVSERRRVLPGDAGCIARLFPALRQVLDVDEPAARGNHNSPIQQRAKAMAALKALLAELARQRPVVIHAEDLQWADRDSLELLVSVLQPPAPARVLVLASLRTDDLHADGHAEIGAVFDVRDSVLAAALRALDEHIEVSTIRLAELSADEQRELLSTLAERPEYCWARKHIDDPVWYRLGGHPMLLVELALSATELPEAWERPGRLHLGDFLWNRFTRLPQGARSLMECIALAGKPLPLAVLARASGLSPAECERGASALRVAHLARIARTDPEPWLVAYHDKVRESIGAHLPGPRAQALHRRIAEALETWDSAPAAALADHWLAAKEPLRAAIHRFHAARGAAELLAFERAAELYRSALELLTPAAGENEFDVMRCRACIGLVEAVRMVDRDDEAMELLERAQAIASRLEFVDELATIHYCRGNLLFPRNDFDGCLEQHTIAREYARKAGKKELEARALSGLGDAHYMRGRMVSAHEYFHGCVELCRQHGYGDIEAANLAMRGMTRYYQNDLASGLQDSLDAVATAERFGDRRAEILARNGCVAWILFEMGQFGRARRELEISLDRAHQIGVRRFEPNAYTFLSKVAIHEGRRREAVAMAEASVAVCRELAMMTFAGPMALAALALATDDPHLRQRAVDEGLAILRAGTLSHNYLYFYRDAIDLALAAGDADAALRHAQGLEDYTRPEPLAWCGFFVERARALADHLRGRGEPARLQRVLAQAREVGLHTAARALERALGS